MRDVKDAAGRAASSVRDGVEQGYEAASDWASDQYESASRNVTYARRRSAAEFNRSRQTVEGFVEENPIMVGVVGLAAGLLIGALLPTTRRENQYFGRYADEVRSEGYRYAHDAVEQGRHLLEENLKGFQQARADRDTGDETSAR